MSTENSTQLTTGKVRLSYLHVFEPRPADKPEDKPRFSACILIPKKDKNTVAAINAGVDAAIVAGSALVGSSKKTIKLPLRDGDEEKDGEEFAGHYFINCSSIRKPHLFDEDKNPILGPVDADGEITLYSGCYGRAVINFFAFNHNGKKGIGCGLKTIQKLADGEPLAGSYTEEQALADLDDDML